MPGCVLDKPNNAFAFFRVTFWPGARSDANRHTTIADVVIGKLRAKATPSTHAEENAGQSAAKAAPSDIDM